MRIYVQPVSFRAMPENEIPPAMRVDFYYGVFELIQIYYISK